ncbi:MULTISPECIES: hypothetical protein [Halococcus]|uniref:SIR2-like domain-containing protein n=1 Tax=Halococcus salifodinae DSM 8989 TaxID=1227456 RepID=M0NDD1_9EURY|nr:MULTISPECIES: hypothetical protein [Halococcus]EMA54695.1 hypothetical protein C450_05355 [Halococcus salifodinae DSM 8989]
MRVLVVDQCSGSKQSPEWFDSFDAETIDDFSLPELRERERTPTYSAHDLYTGRQQQYIDVAVDRLRESGDTVDRYYISAGFGFVGEATELPPYEVTFQDYDTESVHERSSELEIQSDLLNRLDDDPAYDLVFLALGSDYYEALDLSRLLDTFSDSTMVVLFNREADAEQRPNVISIPARTAEAKEQGSTVIGLKGQYLKQFAAHRAEGTTIDSFTEVVEYCTTEPTRQSGLGSYD